MQGLSKKTVQLSLYSQQLLNYTANITVFGVSAFNNLGKMSCPWCQHSQAAMISSHTEFKCSKPFFNINLPRLKRIFRTILYIVPVSVVWRRKAAQTVSFAVDYEKSNILQEYIK
jgi:biotin synthase-related radical SAM superfamily protein